MGSKKASKVKANKKGFWKTLSKQKMLCLMSIPFVLYIILFRYVPLWGWKMAFENFYRPKVGHKFEVARMEKNVSVKEVTTKKSEELLYVNGDKLVITQGDNPVNGAPLLIDDVLDNSEPDLDEFGNQRTVTVITQNEKIVKKNITDVFEKVIEDIESVPEENQETVISEYNEAYSNPSVTKMWEKKEGFRKNYNYYQVSKKLDEVEKVFKLDPKTGKISKCYEKYPETGKTKLVYQVNPKTGVIDKYYQRDKDTGDVLNIYKLAADGTVDVVNKDADFEDAPVPSILGTEPVKLADVQVKSSSVIKTYWPAIVGVWKHFAKLFADKEFTLALRNTICMSLISTALGYITAIILAVFMNEVKSIFVKRAVQTLSYLPHFLSWIIVTSLVANVLSTDDGIINNILMKLKIIKEPIFFLAIPKYFWNIIGWTYVWKEVGWNTIVYLGAMTSVDPCLYEAAEIDGCGRLRKIWHITLPGIRPTIIIMMIMSAGHILDSNFEMPFFLKNAMIEDVANTIDIYVLKYGFQLFNYSLATAAGVFKNFVNIILLLIANYIAKKSGEERLI